MSEDDPIRRAAALPPPTTTDVILLHVLAELVREKPKRLERICARARDKAAGANVRALHGARDNPEWIAAFEGAEIRLDSVAEMIRRDVPPPKPTKKRKKS
jgi:hypothetical protein